MHPSYFYLLLIRKKNNNNDIFMAKQFILKLKLNASKLLLFT